MSREVIYEGLRRLQSKGMHFSSIHTAGFNQRAAGLYRACGFTPFGINRTYLKQL